MDGRANPLMDGKRAEALSLSLTLSPSLSASLYLPLPLSISLSPPRSLSLPLSLSPSLPLSISIYLYLALSISISVSPSIYLSIYLPIYPSTCLSVYLSIIAYHCLSSSICLPVYPSIGLSVYLSICLFNYLSIGLSVYPSICPSVCLSICLCAYLSICLSINLSVYLSACLSVCLSPVYLSICLSVYPHVWLTSGKAQNPVHLPGKMTNVQEWSERCVFATFCLQNVLRTTTACTCSTSQPPKVVRTCDVLSMFTSKCASRHNRVHFFDRWTSKSRPTVRCILTSTCASASKKDSQDWLWFQPLREVFVNWDSSQVGMEKQPTSLKWLCHIPFEMATKIPFEWLYVALHSHGSKPRVSHFG